MAKKSFLEKLGLIEAIEADGSDMAFEIADRENDLDNSGDIMDGQAKESIESDEINQSEIFEKLKELSDDEPEAMVQSKGENGEIEDKLNVLIGAYEKNKLLSIDEIYRNARLTSDMKNTIFIVDVFLKTLPENLPIDVKRESVANILNFPLNRHCIP